MYKTLYTFICFLVSLTSYSQQAPSEKWHKFIKPETEAGQAYHHFYLVSTDDAKNTLYNRGNIKIARKLDSHHYIIYFDSKQPYTTIRNTFRFARAVNHLWKLSPNLILTEKQSNSTREEDFLIKVTALDQCKKILRKSNSVKILHEYAPGNTLIIRTSLKYITEELLPATHVLYISRHVAVPKEESLVLDLNLNVNKVNLLHHKFPDLNGMGYNISIKEQRFDETDIDFKGRVLPSLFSSETTSRHASEMATIVAGAGNTSFNSRGVAWGANLSSSNFMNLFPDDISYFEGSDIYIQNHAYGTGIENFYGGYAAAYDEHTHSYPTQLHIFSAGNNGAGTDTVGTYSGVEGYANLTGNFKMAKNILTVSAVDTLHNTDPFVSKGPAYDGRVKPELAAYSTVGSSSSAALVSGLSIVLQQAYQLKNAELPDATLLKGILMNSADDMGPEGVDFLSGYGSINAKRALQTINADRFITGSVNDGQTETLTINIPSNAINLKVMLVWNDPAATVNAGTALVNDLDLTLKHQGSGDSWMPWVLNSYPHKDSLKQLPVRKPDHLNNAEQITLDLPEPGSYEIAISGFDIVDGPQKFFVVYQWDETDAFQWTFPVGNSNMPYNGERVSFFRWESTFDGQSGILEYSLDKGSTWLPIADNVDLSKQYYSWDSPDVYSTALARMTVGAEEFVSDTFTISRPLKVSVGFNCPDSVMFLWNNLENTSAYTLYTVGEKYLEPLLEVTDTSVILDKGDYPYTLYTIAPTLGQGKSGLRNLTFDYSFQGVDCYLSSFFALENTPLGQVVLTLSLGTNYQVKRVVFEREQNSTFTPVVTVNSPSSNIIEGLDTEPFQGLNHYRARVIFEGGAEIMTETVTVYFLTKRPVMIFPNPADRSQGELSVFTRDFAGEKVYLRLLNSNGQEVLNYELLSEREVLPISHLKPGLYLYTLISAGVEHSGKIVIK
ncbi:S8 family peptidase [Fulvivirga ulvae]|uniref:S8 family serine peptidase n=1 Tax=Fulvivirga ulvae TaxID=2904245 RepID=UPI001F1C5003|nr:S8 family serine peptidase [Fulvivirga ulvae]UII30024.1 S8 family peptidase [Fulvivirga ulvae]